MSYVVSCRPLTHLALFQKYRCGTSRRAGPPCSGSSGSPSYSSAIHALPPRRSSSGTFVVYPPSQKARTNAPLVSTPSSSVSTDTPVHVVSSFDHLVTQWMSTVTVSRGSARNSSQLQESGWATGPPMVKVQRASGVRGGGS